MKIKAWNEQAWKYITRRNWGIERIGDTISQFDGWYIFIRQYTIAIYWNRKG